MRKFNQTAGSLSRQTKEGGRRSGRAPATTPYKEPPPLCEMLFGDDFPDLVKCTPSIFEAKGGLRAATLEIASGAAFDKIVQAPIAKKAIGKVHSALKQGLDACVQAITGGKQVVKRFDELVAGGCTSELRTKSALPRAEWASRIFEVEAFGTDSAYANANWPNYGMMQALLLISGDFAIMGVKTDRVQGATFAAKRAEVMRMSVEGLKALVADGGFFNRFSGGVDSRGKCLMAVPSGFLILTAGSNARMLRWSFVADELDHQRVKASFQGMLDSFGELRAITSPSLPFAIHLSLRV